MEEVEINDWNSFSKFLRRTTGWKWFYRGVSSVQHDLLPKIGRKELCPNYSPDIEKFYFQRFKERAPIFLEGNREPQDD